jgi:hypothetical protein
MPERSVSRFDAEAVPRLATVNATQRLEMQFSDAQSRQHVVSLPLGAAVALARLICDLTEATPFLKGRAEPTRAKQK